MYAIVRSGGKQYKVSEGDVLEVERVGNGSDKVELTPVLIVDDKGKTTAGRDLSGASVTATVVDEVLGPKVRIFKYRSKTRYRRKLGHRQQYQRIEISQIKLTKGRSKARSSKSQEA